MTINDLSNLVCKELPEHWEITISLENGYGGVNLYDPLGENVDFGGRWDGEDLEAQVKHALAKAKSH